MSGSLSVRLGDSFLVIIGAGIGPGVDVSKLRKC